MPMSKANKFADAGDSKVSKIPEIPLITGTVLWNVRDIVFGPNREAPRNKTSDPAQGSN